MSHVYSFIDINALSEEQWEYYFAHVHSREKAYHDLQALKNRFRSITDISYFSRINFILEDGVIIGSLVFSIGSASRPYDASVYTNCINNPGSRLNLFLLETIAGAMSEYRDTPLRLIIQCKPLTELFLNFSIRISKKVYFYSLKFDEDIRTSLQEIYDSYPHKNLYRLELLNHIPDNLIQEYCNYFTEFVRDIPGRSPDDAKYTFTPKECRRAEEQASKRGWINIYMFVYETGNPSRPAGIANIVYNKAIDTTYHIITGIKEDHRGKGLSKFMKSGLYLRLLEEYPGAKTVVTDNYDCNTKIRNVNESIGFKVNREQIEFEVSAGDLHKILDEIKSVQMLSLS